MLTATGGMDSALAQSTFCRITVVFNNIPQVEGLQTAWGFACVIEGFEQTILFDTGSNGDILLENMQHLGIDPATVDTVVLSHYHGDHTGGLNAFLAVNPAVSLYGLQSFPAAFQNKIKAREIEYTPVKTSIRLCDKVYSTGETGNGIKEQALVLDTPKGLVVITGCAHPGIVRLTRKALRVPDKEIYLVMGGFHMIGFSPSRINHTLQELKALGVRRTAPGHCTGDSAMEQFREQWGDDFIAGGCGAVIDIRP